MMSNTNGHSGFYCSNSYSQVSLAYSLVFAAFCAFTLVAATLYRFVTFWLLREYRVCPEYTK